MFDNELFVQSIPWETFVYRPIFECLYADECIFGTRLGTECALMNCKYKRFFFSCNI